MKQTYEIENIRLFRNRSLQNIYPLVIATVYFVCALLDVEAKLKLLIQKIFRTAKGKFSKRTVD